MVRRITETCQLRILFSQGFTSWIRSSYAITNLLRVVSNLLDYRFKRAVSGPLNSVNFAIDEIFQRYIASTLSNAPRTLNRA